MLSYWEKQSEFHTDLMIIGAGIVGLSTALSIKEKSKNLRVVVLDRSEVRTGASTKNAGFACIGSLTEILDDLHQMSKQEVMDLVLLRYTGLNKLRQRLGDKNIGYIENGSYELLKNSDEQTLNRMDEVNQMLLPVLEKQTFCRADDRLKSFGFSSEIARYLIRNNLEGEINTAKMMQSLERLCVERGIEIRRGCQVSRVEEESNCVRLILKHPNVHLESSVTCSKVAICTNAFTGDLFPELDLKPGRGHVLITKPINGLPFKGIFHFDKGYYYFRRFEDRVLFGGGRNLDFDTETTTAFSFNEKIKADLLKKLQQDILPRNSFQIEDWWVGIMAFGSTKQPIIRAQGKRIFLGVRMGGMGVAIGSKVGEQLSELICRNA